MVEARQPQPSPRSHATRPHQLHFARRNYGLRRLDHQLRHRHHIPSGMDLGNGPTKDAMDQGRLNTPCVPRHPPAASPTMLLYAVYAYQERLYRPDDMLGCRWSYCRMVHPHLSPARHCPAPSSLGYTCTRSTWPRYDYVRRVYGNQMSHAISAFACEGEDCDTSLQASPNSKFQLRGAGPRHRLTRPRLGIDNILALGPAPQSHRPYCHLRTSSARPRPAKTVLEVRRLTSNHPRRNGTILSTSWNSYDLLFEGID